MNIEFTRLSKVDRSDIIEILNHPLVRRHMPLAQGIDDEASCAKFIEAKELMWKENGFGAWAIIVDGKFVGWGGLQPEGEDVEIALVLHPRHWGLGKLIYAEIIRQAFEELHLTSVIVLFPPSRTRIKGLLKLGFMEDGELEIDNHKFLRFRLHCNRNGHRKR